MIASLIRPRVVLSAVAAVWLLGVGAAITAANTVPTTHAGVERISLPEALLSASIRIEPEDLNLDDWPAEGTLSVFVSLPSPHLAEEIVPSSVELCVGERCVSSDGRWSLVGDSTMQSEFERDSLRRLFQGVHGVVTLNAVGQLTVTPGQFEGGETIVLL